MMTCSLASDPSTLRAEGDIYLQRHRSDSDKPFRPSRFIIRPRDGAGLCWETTGDTSSASVCYRGRSFHVGHSAFRLLSQMRNRSQCDRDMIRDGKNQTIVVS